MKIENVKTTIVRHSELIEDGPCYVLWAIVYGNNAATNAFELYNSRSPVGADFIQLSGPIDGVIEFVPPNPVLFEKGLFVRITGWCRNVVVQTAKAVKE